MWVLEDAAVKAKLLAFASCPSLVTWTRRAERDMGCTPGLTKRGVLDGLFEHITCNRVVHEDVLQNGDEAFIFDCYVGRRSRYVKVKFITLGDAERMHVISAHDHERS